MVTKRAKRWLSRGATIAAIVAVVMLVVASWVQGAAIERDWLTFRTSLDEGEAVLVESGDGTVLLRDGDDLDRPGTWSLHNRDGWMQIGPIVSIEPDGVRRELLEERGTIRPGSGVLFSRMVWQAEDPPVELQDIVFDGPRGEHTGWVMEGTEDTWVVLVHGNGADRSEALRILPALRSAGFPVIVPTYRNDFGAGASDSGRHGFGLDEWRDIDAAVDYALEAGARDFILFGYGSGGSVVGTFLYQSRSEERVLAVVLDAPVLSLGIAVDEAWRPSQVPGFIAGWAKAIATFRFGVDWSGLDHVERVEEWKPPVLILHGLEDHQAPLRASAEFTTAAIDRTVLLTFPDAGHGTAWNTDPERYEQAVVDFVTEHGAGESTFLPVESTTGSG